MCGHFLFPSEVREYVLYNEYNQSKGVLIMSETKIENIKHNVSELVRSSNSTLDRLTEFYNTHTLNVDELVADRLKDYPELSEDAVEGIQDIVHMSPLYYNERPYLIISGGEKITRLENAHDYYMFNNMAENTTWDESILVLIVRAQAPNIMSGIRIEDVPALEELLWEVLDEEDGDKLIDDVDDYTQTAVTAFKNTIDQKLDSYEEDYQESVRLRHQQIDEAIESITAQVINEDDDSQTKERKRKEQEVLQYYEETYARVEGMFDRHVDDIIEYDEFEIDQQVRDRLDDEVPYPYGKGDPDDWTTYDEVSSSISNTDLFWQDLIDEIQNSDIAIQSDGGERFYIGNNYGSSDFNRKALTEGIEWFIHNYSNTNMVAEFINYKDAFINEFLEDHADRSEMIESGDRDDHQRYLEYLEDLITMADDDEEYYAEILHNQRQAFVLGDKIINHHINAQVEYLAENRIPELVEDAKLEEY